MAVVRVKPLTGFPRVTTALEMTAPVGSVTRPVRVPAFPADCTRVGAGRLGGGAWPQQKAVNETSPINERKECGDGEIPYFAGECMKYPFVVPSCIATRVWTVAECKGRQKVRCEWLFPKENSLIRKGFRLPHSRDAQAGTTSTGGGRLKRANVKKPIETVAGRRVGSIATIVEACTAAGA